MNSSEDVHLVCMATAMSSSYKSDHTPRYICRCYSDGEVIVEKIHKDTSEQQLCITTSPVTKCCFVRGSSGTIFLFLVSGLTVILAREMGDKANGEVFFDPNVATVEIDIESCSPTDEKAWSGSSGKQKPCHVTSVTGCSLLMRSSDVPLIVMIMGHYNGCLTAVVVDEGRPGVPVLLPWLTVHKGLGFDLSSMTNSWGIVDVASQYSVMTSHGMQLAVAIDSRVYIWDRVSIDAPGGRMQISSSKLCVVNTLKGVNRIYMANFGFNPKLAHTELLACGLNGLYLHSFRPDTVECEALSHVGTLKVMMEPQLSDRFILRAVIVPGNYKKDIDQSMATVYCADNRGNIYRSKFAGVTIRSPRCPDDFDEGSSLGRRKPPSKRRRHSPPDHETNNRETALKLIRTYRLTSFPIGCYYDEESHSICFLDYANCAIVI